MRGRTKNFIEFSIALQLATNSSITLVLPGKGVYIDSCTDDTVNMVNHLISHPFYGYRYF